MYPRIVVVYTTEEQAKVDTIRRELKEKFDDFLDEREQPYSIPMDEAGRFLFEIGKIDLLVLTPGITADQMMALVHEQIPHRPYVVRLEKIKSIGEWNPRPFLGRYPPPKKPQS